MTAMINKETGIQASVSVLFVLLVAGLGSYFTSLGLHGWYGALERPAIIPAGQTFGLVWTVLFVLLAVSIFLSWRSVPKTFLRTLGRLYLVNGGLNVLWCYVFFSMHELGGAAITAVLLAFSVFVLIAANVKVSKIAAVLLIPYFLWTSFAVYLSADIAYMNKTPTVPPVLIGNPVDETVQFDFDSPGQQGFTLYVGVTRTIDSHASIKLLRVDDSHCPADVKCIWAGELSPVFTVTVDGQKTELKLGTMTAEKGGVSGYHFTLLDAGLDFAKVSVER